MLFLQVMDQRFLNMQISMEINLPSALWSTLNKSNHPSLYDSIWSRLEETKDSPLTLEMLNDTDFHKAIRELKPENYRKVLSFVEKFPNSVDALDSIIRRLNSGETTEIEEFMTSPSYMEEMKRNSAGKYQKELLDMFSPENLSGGNIFNMLRMATSKEDFLNGIKKMSKSTFKLAYDRPNQYLSEIDTKYTDPVNGKLPELEPEILEGQRKKIEKFFFDNLEDIIRILKYVDTDTVSHLMDRRTDLFKENMAQAGDGTLASRLYDLRGNAWLKTGSLSNISAISGYVNSLDGHKYALTIFVQNFKDSSKEVKNFEDELITLIYSR